MLNRLVKGVHHHQASDRDRKPARSWAFPVRRLTSDSGSPTARGSRGSRARRGGRCGSCSCCERSWNGAGMGRSATTRKMRGEERDSPLESTPIPLILARRSKKTSNFKMILYSKVLFGYWILGGRADVSSSCSWKTVPSLPSFYGEGSSCYGQQWRGYCKVKKFVGQLHCFQAIARWSHTIQKAPLTATPGEHNNHPSPVLQQPVHHHHRTCGLSVFIVSSWKFWILATARLLNQAGKWNLWRSPGHSRAHPDHNPFSLGSHLETSQTWSMRYHYTYSSELFTQKYLTYPLVFPVLC